MCGSCQGRSCGGLVVGTPRPGFQVYEIIGVVSSTGPLDPGCRPMPTYYRPIQGLRYMEATIQVRHQGDDGATVAAIRRAAAEIDPNLLVKTTTIEQNVQQRYYRCASCRTPSLRSVRWR